MMTTRNGTDLWFALNVAILGLASLGVLWGLGSIVTKSPSSGEDRVARIVASVGLIFVAIAGLRGTASPVRTAPGIIGYIILVSASTWIAIQMRRRAGTGN